MSIHYNNKEGSEIEKVIARILDGKIARNRDYDIDADGKVEVKSFYFYIGSSRKSPGKIYINVDTHNKHKDTSEKYRYIIVGKKKSDRTIRMILILSWKEMDSFLKKFKVRRYKLTNRERCYVFSWVKLLQPKAIRYISRV